MPQVSITGGMKVEIPNRAEIRADVRDVWDEQQRVAARGFKWMRLPEYLTGKVASSAITLGVGTGQTPLGPEQGYAWSVKRLVVGGLTTGATPDVVNLYLNDRFAGNPLWQFNGNNFGYTFGRLELVLGPGDTLSLKSVGTFASTSVITLSGELVEVPAEMLWKLD